MWVSLSLTCGSMAKEEWTSCVTLLGFPMWAPTPDISETLTLLFKKVVKKKKKVGKSGNMDEE